MSPALPQLNSFKGAANSPEHRRQAHWSCCFQVRALAGCLLQMRPKESIENVLQSLTPCLCKYSGSSLPGASVSRASTSTRQSHGSSQPSTAATYTFGAMRRKPSSRRSSSPTCPCVQADSSRGRTGLCAAVMTSNYESTTTTHQKRSPASRRIPTISAQSVSTRRSHSS